MQSIAERRREARKQNEIERQARLPEVMARISMNIALSGINLLMLREPDPKCKNCAMARKFGELLYCGKCMQIKKKS